MARALVLTIAFGLAAALPASAKEPMTVKELLDRVGDGKARFPCPPS